MIIIDTHVLILAMEEEEKRGTRTRELLQTQSDTGRILISVITVWEIALLVQKGRLALARDVAEWVDMVLALPCTLLAPVNASIALDSVRLPGVFHADPADRIMVATARHHSVPPLSADRAILDDARSGHRQAIDAAR